MEKHEILLNINGKAYQICVPPDRLLLDVIREDIGLSGTKRGCEIGECGACTVIMNGHTVNSCLVLALQADGAQITTIEGVGSREQLHPVQQAFLEHDAVQCGFCTPGMVLSAVNLLDKNPQPSEQEIKTALAGNLCRCTGYKPIVDAVKSLA